MRGLRVLGFRVEGFKGLGVGFKALGFRGLGPKTLSIQRYLIDPFKGARIYIINRSMRVALGFHVYTLNSQAPS